MAHGGESEAAGVLAQLWQWLLGLVGLAVAWVYKSVADHEARIRDHESRITNTEKYGAIVAKIAEDVAHIRGRFDEQDQQRARHE